MPEYYVGPFGRMLPATENPTPDREPERPANMPVLGNHPFQLPPPRTSGSLQFGTDPFLRQRNPDQRSDSGVGLQSKDSSPQSTRNEQLPSVSQLLIAPPHSSPPSPYHTHPFGTPTASSDYRDSYFRPNDVGIGHRMPPGSMHDRTKGQPDPIPRRQPGNLPPLTHRAPHSPEGEMASHNMVHGSSPIQTFPHGSLPYPGQGHGEASSSETSDAGGLTPTGTKVPPVRPHVVDERYVDGEGFCYIYADGTHCPKIVDGVHVNANWGVTKAGKPRKRLAQACLTCREKKIKCQPNLPKCDQCQKSGRECRFESAPRGNRAALKASQLSSRYEARDSNSSRGHTPSGHSSSLYNTAPASESSASLPGTGGHSPVSEGSIISPYARDNSHDRMMDTEPSRGANVPGLTTILGTDDPFKRTMDSINVHSGPNYAEILTEMNDIDSENLLANDWKIDPYEVDPELTTHYIDSYFTCVNDNLYYIFPRRRFFLWLRSCRTKSLDDKMLLYWMITMGAVFSDRPDRLMALKRYSRTARYAVEHRENSLSLQLAQSRIIMSLWYYAVGALIKSWDSLGAAVRTVCGLRYNVEAGGVAIEPNQTCEYGLHPQALIECRRRTFWVAFLMDCFSSFYSSSSTSIPSQPTFLRLPCREEIYEAQQYATVPYHRSLLGQAPPSSDDDLSVLSPIAFLVEISSLLGDVSHQILQLSFVPPEAYGKHFDEFHTTVTQRSSGWVAKLPEHLVFTTANLEASIRAKKADAFLSIHVLYHATLMKLNRHARYINLPPGTVDRYLHRARHHAVEILRMSVALGQCAAEYESSRLALESSTPRATVMTPFLGYLILSAVDVISAAGLVADMPESINLIKDSLGMVRGLSRFWDSAFALVALIEARVNSMVESLRSPTQLENKVGFVMDSTSLETQLLSGASNPHPAKSSDDDLMYGGLPREMFFRALGVDDMAFSEDHILWIKEKN